MSSRLLRSATPLLALAGALLAGCASLPWHGNKLADGARECQPIINTWTVQTKQI
jgi:2',3'-cyclic-nucleotide 2'-phosphodiesterase/3'-nucleotidase